MWAAPTPAPSEHALYVASIAKCFEVLEALNTAARPVALTELVEFARRQTQPTYSIPQLQIYKLVFAQWLAEFGYLHRAWAALQSINALIKAQNKYGPSWRNRPLYFMILTFYS